MTKYWGDSNIRAVFRLSSAHLVVGMLATAPLASAAVFKDPVAGELVATIAPAVVNPNAAVPISKQFFG